jgi:hypothetical protein
LYIYIGFPVSLKAYNPFILPLLTWIAVCSSSEIVKKIMEMFCGKNKKKQIHKAGESKKIKGTVVLMKKNVVDATDMKASLFDRIHEFLGKGVSLQLISSTHPDPGHPLSLSLHLLVFSKCICQRSSWIKTKQKTSNAINI